MIYTLTFNPSLDYIIRVKDFRTGQINRTSSEKILPGGKGVNVSIVLSNLGHERTALGFTAGFVGEDIEQLMRGYGCGTGFIRTARGNSRINVKMRSETCSAKAERAAPGSPSATEPGSPDATETEINGQGPEITEEDLAALFAKLDRIKAQDILVISGSVPGSLPSDIYEQIMEQLGRRGIKIVVDAERELLTRVLRYHPFLIKPNHHELGDIFGTSITTREQALPYARKLQKMGAHNVLVSMVGMGAVLVSQSGDEILLPSPRGTLVNSVGAGDSMVAGFLAGWLETKDYARAMRMGLAAGSASAFSAELATRPEVEALLSNL